MMLSFWGVFVWALQNIANFFRFVRSEHGTVKFFILNPSYLVYSVCLIFVWLFFFFLVYDFASPMAGQGLYFVFLIMAFCAVIGFIAATRVVKFELSTRLIKVFSLSPFQKVKGVELPGSQQCYLTRNDGFDVLEMAVDGHGKIPLLYLSASTRKNHGFMIAKVCELLSIQFDPKPRP